MSDLHATRPDVTRENLLKEINFLAQSPGTNAWVRDRLQKMHRVSHQIMDENDRLRSALRPFVFGDPVLENILFGDMDGDRTGTMTIKLRHIREARDVLEPRSHLDSKANR